MIVVISTGLAAPTRERCQASVSAQDYMGKRKHIYIEASSQVPPKCAMQNFYEAASECEPDDIIVMLDGDDWFPHRNVLSKVQAMHDAGALVTYGSFDHSDGRPGFAHPCAPPYRSKPWTMSHLKSIRAWVFQAIPLDHLQHDGEWIRLAWDCAVMWGAAEIAGPDRVTFCKDVLYIYSLSTSFEWTATPTDRADERASVKRIREMVPLDRIVAP